MSDSVVPFPELPASLAAARDHAFPTEALPSTLQSYVRGFAANAGLEEGIVALAALALLAGFAPDHWTSISASGTFVPLGFNLILGLPSTPTAGQLLPDLVQPWLDRQRESLRRSAQLDPAALRARQETALMHLPEELQAQTKAAGAGGVAAARRQWITAQRRPAYLVCDPTVEVLKAGLQSSADHTLLAVFPQFVPLLAPTSARARAFGELIQHLCGGDQLALPGKGGTAPLLQAQPQSPCFDQLGRVRRHRPFCPDPGAVTTVCRIDLHTVRYISEIPALLSFAW